MGLFITARSGSLAEPSGAAAGEARSWRRLLMKQPGLQLTERRALGRKAVPGGVGLGGSPGRPTARKLPGGSVAGKNCVDRLFGGEELGGLWEKGVSGRPGTNWAPRHVC